MGCVSIFVADKASPTVLSMLHVPLQPGFASLQESRGAAGDPTACDQVYCTC